MSYNYKFISNLKQLDQETIEELDKLLEKEASKCTKAFEVGTYAGYVTLLLGGYTGDITTIDYDHFVSPNIDDHKKINSMHFVDRYTGPDLVELFDKHFTGDFDLVYLHRDVPSQIIIDRVKKAQIKDVLFICYEDDKFTVTNLPAPKRTASKSKTEEKVTPTKRQKTTKASKQPTTEAEATV
jgi:hypothetical protein|tara:strand:- start:823 stop:1371 length:549 start_codon:yes stop_codon:yes gene_type:complete